MAPEAERLPLAGSRATRRRSAIIDALTNASTFHSARDLQKLASDAGHPMALSTVYRALQALSAANEVDVLHPSCGEALYRRCTLGHHHHLVCRQCGQATEIADEALEKWVERTANQHGFTEPHHTLEIFGTCQECAKFG
ncbi:MULTISPECIES: Fur family transcriptional regulator [unclassified Arthrobacter]|uniref:Fur family transcriptional regulator n=1 Tax=unclassified Arthrobacter TaxID=235627 RepID=UPI000421883C|nr:MULTISPECIES: Fur family transcriptional regulator [unclassified Arthrobacter]PVE14770.1 transcriptional repressor [Arthrobacter sp. Bz4]